MFTTAKRIRFHHCDPAGIVFFPQYFVLFHETIEDWFTKGLEIDYAGLISSGIGVPVVSVRCDFVRPCSIGTQLQLQLEVIKVGRSSIEVSIRGAADGQEAVAAVLVIVYTSLGQMRSVELPAATRDAVLRYAAASI